MGVDSLFDNGISDGEQCRDCRSFGIDFEVMGKHHLAER